MVIFRRLLLFFGIIGCLVQCDIHAMEHTNKKRVKTPKSSDYDVVIAFAALLDAEVNKMKLEPPKSLYESFVVLKGLCSKFKMVTQDLSIFQDGLTLYETFTVPADSMLQQWFTQAIKKVLKENAHLKKVVNCIIQQLINKATFSNKEKYIHYIEQLPYPVAEHIKDKIRFSYGWNNVKLFSLASSRKRTFDHFVALDSFRVAVAGGDAIKIINTARDANRQQEQKLMHNSPVSAIAYNNNTCLASASDQITIWDINTGESLQVLEGHEDPISELSFINESMLVSQSKKCAKVWDITTGNCIKEDVYKRSWFSDEPKKLYYTSKDAKGEIKLSEIAVNGNARIVNNLLLTISEGGEIQYQTLTHPLKKYSTTPSFVTPEKVIACNDGMLAYCSECNIYILNINQPSSVMKNIHKKFWNMPTLKGHTRSITDLVRLDDTILISVDCTGMLKIWDLTANRCLKNFKLPAAQCENKATIAVTDDAIIIWRGCEVHNIAIPTFEDTFDAMAHENYAQEECMQKEINDWQLV